MAKGTDEGLDLPWQTLLIAVLPMVVFLASDWFLDHHGAPSNVLPSHFRPFDGHLETAARLSVLSTFVLFIGVAVAALVALAMMLWTLRPASRARIGLGVAILALAGWAMIVFQPTRGIPDDIGQPLFCAAAQQSVGVSPDLRHAVSDPVAAGEQWNKEHPCTAASFTRLNALLGLWKRLVFAATAAVIFGTICCLALPFPLPSRPAQAAFLKRQAGRLNTFLYLSATLMVAALLVQGAFIRWPRFALTEPSSFDAHVGSIIFYYGTSYSVFLASFYLPVALWLARRAEWLGAAELKEEVIKAARAGPVAVIKVAASILAPAVAGLLSAFVELPG